MPSGLLPAAEDGLTLQVTTASTPLVKRVAYLDP